MLKKHTVLFAPNAPAEVMPDTPGEADPAALAGWMSGLGKLDTDQIDPVTPDTKKPEDKTNGNPNEKPAGSVGTPPNPAAQPGSAAAPKSDATTATKADGTANEPGDKAGGKKDDGAAKADVEKVEKKDEVAEKWPRSSNDWERYKKVHAEKEAKLQKEIETREARIKEYEAKVKAIEEQAAKAPETSPELTAKLAKLESDNAEMSNRLRILDVTQHPKFQAYFSNKVNAQKELAKNIVGTDKFAEFEKMISLPNSPYKSEQIENFLADLPTLQQSRIGAVLNNLDTIDQERAAAIQEESGKKTQVEADQKAKMAAFATARDKAIDDYVKSIQSGKDGETLPIYMKRHSEGGDTEADVAWNRGVDERIATAKALLTGKDVKPQDVLKAAFNSVALPAVLEAYQSDMMEKDEAIAKLQKQVEALSAAQPKTGSSAVPPTGDTTKTTAPPKIGQSPFEAAAAFTKNLWSEG